MVATHIGNLLPFIKGVNCQPLPLSLSSLIVNATVNDKYIST